jgi:hemerythrin
MALVAWSRALSVGVASLDLEHHELVNLLNSLHDELLKKRSNETLVRIVNQFIKNTVIHFKREEDLFRKYRYPQGDAHRAEHDILEKTATELEAALRDRTSEFSMDTLIFLREWLICHIQGSDMQYKAFFATKGVK